MERLTKRNDMGLPYLAKVKEYEQEVESPYPDTLRCIMECFARLAEYEDKIERGELVEVVRCGDCKHRFINHQCLNSDSGYYERERNSNDYCSDGERTPPDGERSEGE